MYRHVSRNLPLTFAVGLLLAGVANAAPGPRAVLGINIASGPGAAGPAEGVVVVGITPGGPADQAGLAAEDVIVRINDEPLTAESRPRANRRLLDFMADVAPGDELTVTYLRGGEAKEARLVAGELDPEMMPPMRGFMGSWERFGEEMGDHLERHLVEPLTMRWRHHGLFAGMELVALTPELGRYFGTEEGLLVVRGPSDDTIPLEDGDVIQEIGGRTPRDPGHAMRIFRSYEPGEELVIDIVRDKRKREVEVKLPVAETPDS